jgi:streptogramin lyase
VSETTFGGGGRVIELDASGQILTTLQLGALPEAPRQAIAVAPNTYWVADYFKGLYLVKNNAFTNFQPNAPYSIANGVPFFTNDLLYTPAGSVNSAWQYTFNTNGVHTLDQNYWSAINKFTHPALDTIRDIICGTADVLGNIWLGSYGGGLVKMNNANVQVYKQDVLEAAIGDPTSYRISGLAVDENNGLWVANYGAPSLLKLVQPNGTFQYFTAPFSITENSVANVTIDKNKNKWLLSPKGGGVIIFNEGASLTASNDDKWKWLRMDQHNLPSNQVNTLAIDKDDIVWLGTDKGVALMQCNNVFANTCVAVLPIVQQDQFAGYLFQNEKVQAIAVDGANRKWIGTQNGVWLINEAGDKIIYRFSTENSPLLSNDVKHIIINPNSGEVFFITLAGTCSFRSTATESKPNNNALQIFPNPVPGDFTGLIAIQGLQPKSIVKITDLNGRLVFQTKALGGQAVWNGKNYNNQAVHSGAYLVLVTDENNNEKLAGKIFFVNK